MEDISHFESRTGKVTGTSGEVFDFVTDIRNFEQFIPEGTISEWKVEKESCSFNVPMAGTISFRIAGKEPFSKVVFSGDALKKNDFTLTLNISDSSQGLSEVKISLDADLNPMLRMMATKPVGRFMDIIIDEMEKFRGWKDIRQ
jgi:carbon monoxide dehydrogenase subunit G